MKKLRYIIIAFLSLGLFSCSDYLEHNFNDQMTIEEVFTAIFFAGRAIHLLRIIMKGHCIITSWDNKTLKQVW